MERKDGKTKNKERKEAEKGIKTTVIWNFAPNYWEIIDKLAPNNAISKRKHG